MPINVCRRHVFKNPAFHSLIMNYEQYILHDKTSISLLKTDGDIMKDIILPYNVFNILSRQDE